MPTATRPPPPAAPPAAAPPPETPPPEAPPPEAPLPDTLCLAPHRTLVPLGAGARLLGLDPAVALALDGLSPPLATMLDELADPTPVTALLDRAAGRGADAAVAEWLLRELLRAGAVVDAGPVVHQARHRGASRVLVSGGGPLAVGLVLGLVRAGVGAVYTEASGAVHAGDLGTGHLDADRGRDRTTSIRDAVRRLCPGADAPPAPARLAPDLVVLSDALVPDPVRVQQLHDAGTAHLPVRMRDNIGLVGPLVVPGRTACLGCLEQERRARAPGWPIVSALLAGTRGRADPAATAATAALGVAQVLVALESMATGGARPPTWEATVELDVTAGALTRRGWRRHPECGCAAAGGGSGAGGVHHDDATSGPGPGRERIMV